MYNLVKFALAISEKKTFKDSTILYMYIAQGEGRYSRKDKILILTKKFHYFYYIL